MRSASALHVSAASCVLRRVRILLRRRAAHLRCRRCARLTAADEVAMFSVARTEVETRQMRCFA